MRKSGVLVIVLVVLANLVGWGLMNRPQEPKPWWHGINGVSFSPYRADQDPRADRHPSAEQIARDLELVASQVRQVRTYSATDGLDAVAPLADRYGLLVTAGAWVDGRLERNEREIANVVRMARRNGNVNRVLVGNESILRADVTVDELIDYIRRVRTQVKVPVSTAEPWHVWLAHPELGREVDFIAIHILPYWEGLPVDRAVDYVLQRYQQVKDAFPTKPVVITEVGWPSDGRMRRAAEPTVTAQAYFLREFLNEADRRRLDYYIMEAFDQPWKRSIEGSVGAYWGIYDADRQAKYSLVGPVVANPDWVKLATLAALIALLPMVWFLRRWSDLKPAGQVFYAGLIQAAAAVFVYVVDTGAGQYMTMGTFAMWAMLLPLLAMLLVMVLTEALELAEVAWARQQKRRFLPFVTDIERGWPKVSIHLPLYNEPPEMVRRTLDALARLDYPDFEVVVVDNNTKDEAVWRPVEAYCQQLGPRFRFFHVAPLAGFKAGALNFALRQTAADAEIVGVIDSDYLVEPNWLKSVVPYFDRAEVGFVQAPQDHYDWRGDAFKEMMNWEYAGFFNIGMVQRNERDAIIQHGTMTLIRRRAIDDVGPWAEWCITEDAEMGLRLLAGGWQSVYLNHRFGYGMTPDSFSGYKSQRFRWAYGAMQILKKHWREMLPGKDRKLTPMQRFHFVAGWMPWFADAVGLVFAVASLVWTVGVLALPRYFEFPLTLFLVPALAVFAAKVAQFLVLYALRVDCSLGQRLGAGMAGLALTFTIAKATFYGIFTRKLPFIRTPKCEDQPAFVQALAMAREETTLFILLWLAGIAVWAVYGGDDPEARLWSLVMFAQSLPFGASLATAAVNTLPRLRRRRIAPAAGQASVSQPVAAPAAGD
jgi:exo-beta-1,3-glucanase (GH17 family)/cellulose synthase/poly-beta-1,6-N-acetylglucosamine synthase-like glycosyltransferase